MLLLAEFGHIRADAGELVGHELGGDIGHVDVADLGDQGHRAGCPGIGFQHIDCVLVDGVLHVHQAHHAHLAGDVRGVLADDLLILLRNFHGGDHAGGVSGVDAGLLNVLHDCGHKGVGSVGDGVRLALHGILQEHIHEDGPLGGHVDGGSHVIPQHVVVVDHLHAPAAQNVGGADHHGVADAVGDLQGLLHGDGHAGLRHGDAQLLHHGAELVAVLRHIDDLGGGSQDVGASPLQLRRDV